MTPRDERRARRRARRSTRRAAARVVGLLATAAIRGVERLHPSDVVRDGARVVGDVLSSILQADDTGAGHE